MPQGLCQCCVALTPHMLSMLAFSSNSPSKGFKGTERLPPPALPFLTVLAMKASLPAEVLPGGKRTKLNSL